MGLHARVKRDDTLHHVDRSLALLRDCGLRPGEIRNEFVLPDDALDEARRFFAAAGLDPPRPTLFIQPFTSSPFKSWPLDRHLAVAWHGRERGSAGFVRRRPRGTPGIGAGASSRLCRFRRSAFAGHRRVDEIVRAGARRRHRRAASGGGDGQASGDDHELHRRKQFVSVSTRRLDGHAGRRHECSTSGGDNDPGHCRRLWAHQPVMLLVEPHSESLLEFHAPMPTRHASQSPNNFFICSRAVVSRELPAAFGVQTRRTNSKYSQKLPACFFHHRLGPAFAALLGHARVVMRAVQADAQVGPASQAAFAAPRLAGQCPFLAAVVAMTGHSDFRFGLSFRFCAYPNFTLVNRKS